MSVADLVKREGPWIKKIIADETWLCGERRGKPVDPKDKEVQDKVCDIIIEKSSDLRRLAERAD